MYACAIRTIQQYKKESEMPDNTNFILDPYYLFIFLLDKFPYSALSFLDGSVRYVEFLLPLMCQEVTNRILPSKTTLKDHINVES